MEAPGEDESSHQDRHIIAMNVIGLSAGPRSFTLNSLVCPFFSRSAVTRVCRVFFVCYFAHSSATDDRRQ